MIQEAFVGSSRSGSFWFNRDPTDPQKPGWVPYPGALVIFSDLFDYCVPGRVFSVVNVYPSPGSVTGTSADLVLADNGPQLRTCTVVKPIMNCMDISRIFSLECCYPGALMPQYELTGGGPGTWQQVSRFVSGFILPKGVCGWWWDAASTPFTKVVKKVKAIAAPTAIDYPHTCPRCGKPAYIGLAKVDCSGGCS